MVQTRQKLLENFDDEVSEKLKFRAENSKEVLGRFERLLIQLTRHELQAEAEFLDETAFRLDRLPDGDNLDGINLGLYELPRKSDTAYGYRMGHPLAEMLIDRAKSRDLESAEIQFDYGAHEGKVTALEPFIGMSGSLSLSLFTIDALDQTEDYLIFSALTDDGVELDEDPAKRLLSLPGQVSKRSIEVSDLRLDTQTQHSVNLKQQQVAERNASFFEEEAKKLDAWADDLKVVLEREIKEMDRQIKEAKRSATTAVDLASKLAGQKQVKALESARNQKRRSLFEAQDEVDFQRDKLISEIEAMLKQKSNLTSLFKIRWSLA